MLPLSNCHFHLCDFSSRLLLPLAPREEMSQGTSATSAGCSASVCCGETETPCQGKTADISSRGAYGLPDLNTSFGSKFTVKISKNEKLSGRSLPNHVPCWGSRAKEKPGNLTSNEDENLLIFWNSLIFYWNFKKNMWVEIDTLFYLNIFFEGFS